MISMVVFGLATKFRNNKRMGEYGSGRYGGRPTSEACASYVLRTTDLLRAGLRAGIRTHATLSFSGDDDPFPIALVIDSGDGSPVIEFAHRSRTRDSIPQCYRVRLLSMPQHLGGVRWWFECPRTGRRCVKLYLPRGGHRFWSRAAYRLGYACQREDRMYQAQRQALKVYRALEGEGNWRDGAPPKPKWMRWRTYERLADKLDFHNARFDGGWLVSVSRLLGRRPASS
jgi:hypothetical protein